MKKSVCMRRPRVGKRIVPKWLHEFANTHRTYIMHSYIQADSRQASTQACIDVTHEGKISKVHVLIHHTRSHKIWEAVSQIPLYAACMVYSG